jgi:hypothetical protein
LVIWLRSLTIGNMTLDDYKEEYDGAPIDIFEFAYGATQVTDSPALSNAAQALLEAHQAFQNALGSAGIEQG